MHCMGSTTATTPGRTDAEMAKRASTKGHEFSATQKHYMAARAAHEVALEGYQAECDRLGIVETDDMTIEQRETVWEKMEDVRAKWGVDRLSTIRIEAERALIDWSLDHVASFAPEQRETIEMLRAKKSNLHVWEKLVDIAARLAA